MSTSAYCSRRGSKVAEGLKREGRYYGNELIPMLDRTHASPKATEKTQQAEVLLPKYTCALTTVDSFAQGRLQLERLDNMRPIQP